MKTEQRITLRLQAHNIITEFLISQGMSRDDASKAAFDQVKAATDNLLKKVLSGYDPGAVAAQAKRNAQRRADTQARKDCGLVRGRDSQGRVIWE